MKVNQLQFQLTPVTNKEGNSLQSIGFGQLQWELNENGFALVYGFFAEAIIGYGQ